MQTFRPRDTIRLPVFYDDGQHEEPVDGYEVLRHIDDGRVHKVEIQPYRSVGPADHGRLRPMQPVGHSYTIGPGDLIARILSQHHA